MSCEYTIENNILEFCDNFNNKSFDYYKEIIEKEKVRNVFFPIKFNQPINNFQFTYQYHAKQFPDNLYLNFGNSFNQPINDLKINKNKTGDFHKFINRFNRSWLIKSCNLKKRLLSLEFGNRFNQPIDYLLDNVINLTLGTRFNQPLDNLQVSFIQEKKKFLKRNKTWMKFCSYLPNYLKSLELGRNFNQKIKKLPDDLEALSNFSTGPNFNNYIDLPNKLKDLYLHELNHEISEDYFPKNLKNLHIRKLGEKVTKLDFFPENLDLLTLCVYDLPVFNKNSSLKNLRLFSIGEKLQKINNLPDNIEKLQLLGNFNSDYLELPKKLKRLELGLNFNQPIDNLPNSLEYLRIMARYFDQNINNLPLNLKKIVLDQDQKFRKKLVDNISDVKPINCLII